MLNSYWSILEAAGKEAVYTLDKKWGFPLRVSSADVIKLPIKYLLVFKTCWRRLQDMSWRRLQHVFSVTIFCLPRRLEDVLKTSWKTKNCYAEDVLKTCLEEVLRTCLEDFLKTCLEDVLKTSWRHILKTSWRHVLKTSSRRLGDKKKWGYLHLTNLNVCVSNKFIFQKSISDDSKANPKSLIRTQ